MRRQAWLQLLLTFVKLSKVWPTQAGWAQSLPQGPWSPSLHDERFCPSFLESLPWPGNQAPRRADRLANRNFWLPASSLNYSRLSIYEMFIFLKSGG
jgi:hypothetical protein